MEDVFDVLAEDHEEIRQALAELEKGPTAATGATEDQLMLRKIMTEELLIEASKHEEIELTCLWPAVREHVASGEELADRAQGHLDDHLLVFGDVERKGLVQPQVLCLRADLQVVLPGRRLLFVFGPQTRRNA